MKAAVLRNLAKRSTKSVQIVAESMELKKNQETTAANTGNEPETTSESSKTKTPMVVAPPDGTMSTQTLAAWLNRSKSHPVVNTCHMAKENMDEAMEVILNAAEKYPWENQMIAQEIKKNLDDRLDATWHVIVGESFSFDIEYETDHLLYLFYGSLGIAVWKCGTILKNEIKHKKERSLVE